jgi:hypothetical protein
MSHKNGCGKQHNVLACENWHEKIKHRAFVMMDLGAVNARGSHFAVAENQPVTSPPMRVCNFNIPDLSGSDFEPSVDGNGCETILTDFQAIDAASVSSGVDVAFVALGGGGGGGGGFFFAVDVYALSLGQGA